MKIVTLLLPLSAAGQQPLEWIIKLTFEQAFPHAGNGLAAVKFKGKWGYIDKAGKGVIGLITEALLRTDFRNVVPCSCCRSESRC